MNTLLKVVAGATAVLILVVAAFAGGVFFDRVTSASPIPSAGSVDLEDAVSEVADIIDRQALEPANETSITAGAIRGMLEGLDDPYAVYFDAEHYRYFSEQSSGAFYGIGVTIANREDDLVIMSVIEGTPAEAAGLEAEDVIVTIDGESRPKWDVDEAVLRIRGEEGTQVTLGIRRGEDTELRDFSITRARIDVPNTESEMLEGNVGYIRLYTFNQLAAGDLRDEIETLTAEGAEGFILDLRDNPGGLLSASVDVGSLFIADGIIVRVEDRNGTLEEHRADGNVITDAPLVVLINGNSASASEIVGGALQDYARATLVGEQSFGKGSVQQIDELSFGGAVKLTIAHYLTPKGQVIDQVGLTPDVIVEMEPELQMDKATDTQLQEAIEVLRGEL